MDTRRLRYFVRIADCGSISRAAADAGVAQPALSQQLAVLEKEIGRRLLERSAAGVVLTPAGRALYQRAKIVLGQIDEMREEVRAQGERLSGPALVGVAPSMMETIGLPLIERVCREQPNLRLQVLEEGSGQLEDLLASGGADLAVTPWRPNRSDLEAERLLTEPLVLVLPAGFDEPGSRDLIELAKLPWVTTRRAHSVRALVEAAFAQAGLAYRIVVEIDSLHGVIGAVERGLGVTVLPWGVARHAARLHGLRLAPFGHTPVHRPIFLGRRAHAQATAATAFLIDALRDIACTVAAAQEAEPLP